MLNQELNQFPKNPSRLFYIGLAIVMLSFWLPFIPNWLTFIHVWRVELFASVFLLIVLAAAFFKTKQSVFWSAISKDERNFIIFPVIALVIWSAASAIWAPSWRSAIHHALVWSIYLIFYFIVRHLIESGKNYRKLLLVFALTLVLYGIPAILDYCAFLFFGGGSSIGIRFARFGEQVNALSPLVMVGILRLKGKRYVLGVSALAVIWLLVFCSLSRINIFLFVCGAVAVTACVFFIKRFHKYRRRMLVTVAVLILAPLPLHVFTLLSDDANIPMLRRVSNSAGISDSNNFRKLMATLSIEMFKAHPVIGVGADNFGMQANNYRAVYGEQNPGDINLAAAESEIPERSHNEYLQIIAELGVVGGLIFLWFLLGVGLMSFRAVRNRVSLIPLAAITGIGLFLVSSLVSSYSFRLVQNGFVFFFVLAVASKYLLKPKERSGESVAISGLQIRIACAFGIIACLLLAAYSVIRVSSVYYAEKANRVQDIEEALPFYETAFRLDGENPNVHFYLGNRYFDKGRFIESASHLERSIEMGQASSTTFSYLATAYLMSGNTAAAEDTFARAVKLYPQSAFAVTRYAFFLKQNGKKEESEVQYDRALNIDRYAAITWWTMMNEGTQKATDNVTHNKDLLPIMDLSPHKAIYAIDIEREWRFPGEKRKKQF